MDLSAIKQKLDAMSSNRPEREKIDYEAVFWKPSVGKHQIRVVPSMYNPTILSVNCTSTMASESIR